MEKTKDRSVEEKDIQAGEPVMGFGIEFLKIENSKDLKDLLDEKIVSGF